MSSHKIYFSRGILLSFETPPNSEIILSLPIPSKNVKGDAMSKLNESLLNTGHRQRLRERFNKTYSDGLHDYEMLELLLIYSIARRDVKPLAKKLLDHFGSVPSILDASPDELQQIKGIGPTSATHIKLVKELCTVYLARQMEQKDLLTSPHQAVQFARMKLAGLGYEVFMAIFLNSQNEMMSYEIIHQGTIDQVAVYPRRLVEKALQYHASGLIVVHNHPSGHTQPSEEDKNLTRLLLEAAKLFDIRLLDHIIVGQYDHFSFLAHGFLSDRRQE